MAIHYRTQGFILQRVPQGDTDVLFRVYTKEYGMVDLWAISGRKITSKLRGGMELFSLADIEFIQGRSKNILTDAATIERYPQLRARLKALQTAWGISRFAERTMPAHQPDEAIWGLYQHTFRRLNDATATPKHVGMLYNWHVWNMLDRLGYRPWLKSCILCESAASGKTIWFSFNQGGIVCDSCRAKRSLKDSVAEISRPALLLLQDMLEQGEDFSLSGADTIDEESRGIVSKLSRAYPSYIIDSHSYGRTFGKAHV